MDKKLKYMIPLLVVFTSVFLLAYGFNFNSEGGISSEIEYNSMVCKQITRADGSVEAPECSSNLLMSAGAEAIEQILGVGLNVAAYDYIALCNATAGCTDPAAGDTTLDNELAAGGLSRSQGDYTSNGNGNWTISETFTASANNLVTNVTGIFNASSSGTMLAQNSFTSATLQSSDQLTVNWTIWVA